MHRSETRELTSCADCGADVWPDRDRAYAFGPEACLCFDCAVRRGGSYDETHDRWLRPPDSRGLDLGED